MWVTTAIGSAPTDHRRCYLDNALPDRDWVWVDASDDTPITSRGSVMACARSNLSGPASRPAYAIGLLNGLFCTAPRSAGRNASPDPGSHDVRNIHFNRRNWPLIPLIPETYRYPRKAPWGNKLQTYLAENNLEEAYEKETVCPFCKCR